MLFKGIFCLFLALAAILFSGQNHFSNLSRGLTKIHFCKTILKSSNWSGRRGHLKVFLLFFSSDGHFVQRSLPTL